MCLNLRVNMAEELKLDNLKAVKVLGKGGMGTVFLVQLENNNSHVALKVVDKSSNRSKRGLTTHRFAYRCIVT